MDAREPDRGDLLADRVGDRALAQAKLRVELRELGRDRLAQLGERPLDARLGRADRLGERAVLRHRADRRVRGGLGRGAHVCVGLGGGLLRARQCRLLSVEGLLLELRDLVAARGDRGVDLVGGELDRGGKAIGGARERAGDVRSEVLADRQRVLDVLEHAAGVLRVPGTEGVQDRLRFGGRVAAQLADDAGEDRALLRREREALDRLVDDLGARDERRRPDRGSGGRRCGGGGLTEVLADLLEALPCLDAVGVGPADHGVDRPVADRDGPDLEVGQDGAGQIGQRAARAARERRERRGRQGLPERLVERLDVVRDRPRIGFRRRAMGRCGAGDLGGRHGHEGGPELALGGGGGAGLVELGARGRRVRRGGV